MERGNAALQKNEDWVYWGPSEAVPCPTGRGSTRKVKAKRGAIISKGWGERVEQEGKPFVPCVTGKVGMLSLGCCAVAS